MGQQRPAPSIGRPITLTWAPPGDTCGSPVSGNRVTRDGTDTGATGPYSTMLPADARSVTFRHLLATAPYSLSVAAVTSRGVGRPATLRAG